VRTKWTLRKAVEFSLPPNACTSKSCRFCFLYALDSQILQRDIRCQGHVRLHTTLPRRRPKREECSSACPLNRSGSGQGHVSFHNINVAVCLESCERYESNMHYMSTVSLNAAGSPKPIVSSSLISVVIVATVVWPFRLIHFQRTHHTPNLDNEDYFNM
jgi:hypothetical protein